MKTPHLDRPRLFNTPLECGLRMLFVLNACRPTKVDLQRLITYDYLIVHSGDVAGSPESLHPAVPFRGTEWLVKRDLVRSGLDLMFARELVDKRLETEGNILRWLRHDRLFCVAASHFLRERFEVACRLGCPTFRCVVGLGIRALHD